MNMIEEQLEKTMQSVRSWPLDRQQDVVRTLQTMGESGLNIHQVSGDDLRSVEIGLAQSISGKHASDESMEAFFRRGGL